MCRNVSLCEVVFLRANSFGIIFKYIFSYTVDGVGKVCMFSCLLISSIVFRPKLPTAALSAFVPMLIMELAARIKKNERSMFSN